MTNTVAAASRYSDLASTVRSGVFDAATRKHALERFLELGFPSTRLEDWKYTNVAPIASTEWQVPEAAGEFSAGEDAFSVPGDRLVFVDGIFQKGLSAVGSLPDGALLTNLASVSRPEHLNRHADSENQPFVALNTAFAADGAYVSVADGVRLERPVFLLFFSTGSYTPVMASPRNLIVAGRNTELHVAEIYIGAAGARYFNNVVTEIVAGPNSIVDHVKLQEESEGAYHVATIQAQQDRDSRLTSTSIAFGAALSRNDIVATLAGEGSGVVLDGLYLLDGEQHADHHTTIDHARPHCDSQELYKGVLDGRSRGVFDGRIVVRKDAQKTNSGQVNKNLILSPEAMVDTKPQLEIYADDVKCTHGSTIGQLDEDALFYLRARGIAETDARNLMMFGFAGEVVSRVRDAAIREHLQAALRRKLPGFEDQP
jgi:Fe-S cluster assembly protein SufD